MTVTLELNAAQREAVDFPRGALLVIAGAGSGKTRVLTARVARLIADGVPPEAILAFTFTNRAAREMRERIAREVGESAARLWVGTFHATGVRILRREARNAGDFLHVPPDFTIYDREDQERILRAVISEVLLDGSAKLNEVLGAISDAKNALVTPDEAAGAAVSARAMQIARCYAGYQRALRANGALDFDDLIAEVVRLFRERPEVRDRYARRFQHVLVDEYQDTNHAQFRLVEALAQGHGNVFVVGDDDQMVYSWRGADLTNILDFETAFPGAAVIRLEQNYRSTANVLNAANAVIANNRARKGKTLWCDREAGAKLTFVLSADEADEARRVAGWLQEQVRRGGALLECAVLYRTNAQSRALETELRQRGLRYEIVGGLAFYQRREIKDLLAYLRVAVNPNDSVSFWRAWNTPRRGLGEALRAKIEERVAAGAPDPGHALRAMLEGGELRAARTGAIAFLGLIDELRANLTQPVDALLAMVLDRTGYLNELEGLGESEARDRRANVEELLVAASQVASEEGEAGTLAFLSETALLTDADRLEEGADRVLLLTAHNAKGLEFPVVIVAGLEEGLFPHASSLDDPKELEEERRLFYVALTRARDRVLLSAAAYRRRADGAWGGQVSRFVDEIPPELLDRQEAPILEPTTVAHGNGGTARPTWARGGGSRSRERPRAESGPAYRTSGPLMKLVGREVYHESFGRGVIVAAEGEGQELKFTVRFGNQIKKVMGRFLTGGHDGD